MQNKAWRIYGAAAFGRLSVETAAERGGDDYGHPAAFGRLSVETAQRLRLQMFGVPAAFGRLSVETQ